MAGNYGSGAGYYPPPAGGYPAVAPSPLVVAPNMYSPPPAVMVTQVTPSVGFVTSPVGIQREWAHGVLDCCAGPTGMSDCCYVMCCPLCAAGDIAQAAGRSCTLASDRQAFAQKYGIQDDLGWCGSCICFWAGCGAFLLCQEYATLKAASSMQTLSYTTVTIPEQQMLVAGVPSGVSPYQAF